MTHPTDQEIDHYCIVRSNDPEIAEVEEHLQTCLDCATRAHDARLRIHGGLPDELRRRLRVVFSKANSGEPYTEVARGAWRIGGAPELSGEPIPPEVLKGLEVQACGNQDPRGTVIYDRADIRYAMDFEAAES
jgi:hypothetical protein